MACCTRYCAAETQFGTKTAQRDLKRYQRRGADGVTRVLLAELRRWPLQNEQLLDVGGGIGAVCAELASNNLASATLVEASPAYLEAARALVAPCYAPRPTRFVLGDFAKMGGTLPEADVVVLDRVVCCYPDADELLRAAASRTRYLLALSYPRDRWFMHAAIGMENLWRRLKGNEFRVLVHSPERMREILRSVGLTCIAQNHTPAWAVEIYRRS